ncbi:hypothetical protein L3X38_037599 [Prunus dulcis]|uniref:Uncharacterized protein n=1 Tax=Prunus dulcis TaxID=3755 RepID=A0AAD4V5C7_PRUDU|nr:hypothetical protein L3X38_037599 [Prunus dulcis]
MDRKILKFPEKVIIGIDQNFFQNDQVNMVNVNFPRPDQPRQRLDLCGPAKAAVERRAREILADPKARGKAKMYLEVAKGPETKVSTKEKPSKAIVLCSRCQCEVTLEVVSPKPDELTKEPTKGLIKKLTKEPTKGMIKGQTNDQVPNTKAGQWYRSKGQNSHRYPEQTRRAQRQYATTCKAKLEWADKRQAELDRLVELREKLRLEELKLAKADVVTSLEAASA